jgi:hypothetical protein
MAQSAFVSCAQNHAGRLAHLECFLPPWCTEAPTVAGFQAAKAEFRHRCRKIVAAGFGKLEKRGGHDDADRVAADVLSPSVAAAVSKEPRHRVYRADFEPVTEHVTWCARPTPSITTGVSQHRRLRARCDRPTADLWGVARAPYAAPPSSVMKLRRRTSSISRPIAVAVGGYASNYSWPDAPGPWGRPELS